jgi:hypothetical protein
VADLMTGHSPKDYVVEALAQIINCDEHHSRTENYSEHVDSILHAYLIFVSTSNLEEEDLFDSLLNSKRLKEINVVRLKKYEPILKFKLSGKTMIEFQICFENKQREETIFIPSQTICIEMKLNCANLNEI